MNLFQRSFEWKEKREHSRDFQASANKKVNWFNLIMLLLNVGPGIDTFQIDCKLQELFSIYLKGFHSLDYTSCCLADRRAAMYADMLNISPRCVWRYRQLRFSIQQFHLCLLITPKAAQFERWFYDVNSVETHQRGYLIKQSPKHRSDDSKYNYIHFLLLFSSFSLRCVMTEIQYRHWPSSDVDPSWTRVTTSFQYNHFCEETDSQHVESWHESRHNFFFK